MKFIQTTIAITILTLLPGCGMMRGIEQWKCDNWGMCHFGIRPSNCGPACGSGTPCAGNVCPLPAVGGNPAPCCGDGNIEPAASYLYSPTPAG